MTNRMKILQGVLLFIFSLLLIIHTWYMVEHIANIFEDPFLKVIFYLGLIGIYTTTLIIMPITLIIQGSKKEIET